MTPMERLARRICWREFGRRPKNLGTTEAKYWAVLPDATRAFFLMEARRFCWLLSALHDDSDRQLVLKARTALRPAQPERAAP